MVLVVCIIIRILPIPIFFTFKKKKLCEKMFRIFFCGGLRPPASGPGFFYIEDSSGNRFMLNGIQELPATVFFFTV